jgi:membrane protein implicated in regulation of membrane protease activity
VGGHSHDAGHEHDGSPLLAAMMFLGVGRAPLMLVLQTFLLLWGVVGICLNLTVNPGTPASLIVSVPVSFIAAAVGTRGLALTFARFFRQIESYHVEEGQLVGKTGQVVFTVDGEMGTIHLHDEHGTLHRLSARTKRGPLDSGQQVIVVDYDSKENVYWVDDVERFADPKR